jgi:hypothetical protein
MAPATGTIFVHYSKYRKKIPILGNSTNDAVIDFEHNIRKTYPHCLIHLSSYAPGDNSFVHDGHHRRPFVEESPTGVYHGLESGRSYWAEIEATSKEHQKVVAFKRLTEDDIGAIRASIEEATVSSVPVDDEDDVESLSMTCTCLRGTPCTDPSLCLDWNNRFSTSENCSRRSSLNLKAMTVKELAELRAAIDEVAIDKDNDIDVDVGDYDVKCKCIRGQPCTVEKDCADWRHRYDVAKHHGWAGVFVMDTNRMEALESISDSTRPSNFENIG